MAKEEIIEKIRKYFGLNNNENTIPPNVWNAAKAMLGKKYVPLTAYIRQGEQIQIQWCKFPPEESRKR